MKELFSSKMYLRKDEIVRKPRFVNIMFFSPLSHCELTYLNGVPTTSRSRHSSMCVSSTEDGRFSSFLENMLCDCIFLLFVRETRLRGDRFGLRMKLKVTGVILKFKLCRYISKVRVTLEI